MRGKLMLPISATIHDMPDKRALVEVFINGRRTFLLAVSMGADGQTEVEEQDFPSDPHDLPPEPLHPPRKLPTWDTKA